MKKDAIFNITKNLFNGALDPADFAKKTSVDYMTEEEKKEDEEISKKALNNTCAPKIVAKPSGIFQCPRCKSMRTFFNQLQTRGGDEPMTNFCECIDCGYSFRR